MQLSSISGKMKAAICGTIGIVVGICGMELLWNPIGKDSTFFSRYTLYAVRLNKAQSGLWMTLFCNRVSVMVLWRFFGLFLSQGILAVFFLTAFGTACGSLGVCLWKRYAWKSILVLLGISMPQAISYGVGLVFFYKKILLCSKRGVSLKDYLICVSFLGMGSFLEAYCNPYLYNMMLQYL